MADDAGEKTLPASAQKRQRAREDGKVARSQDLASAAALLTAMLALRYLGPDMMRRMVAVSTFYFNEFNDLLPEADSVQNLTYETLAALVPLALPFMVLMVLGGVAVNLLQVGFILTGKPLTPKIEKLNPVAGFGNLFNVQALVKLVKSVLVILVVVYIAWLTVRDRFEELLNLMELSPLALAPAVGELIFAIWWRSILALFILGGLDYAFIRWQHEMNLMMTVQEAKEEMKQFEGDPLIKRRIRQMQRQMAMQRMMANVPQADVIITNPVRFAVALRYDARTMEAPKVVAKGARLVAERIRDLAMEHDVPIVQKPDLARALYQSVEVDRYVPGNLFRAVAEVLAYVYQIDRRAEKVRERSEAMGAAR